MVFDVLDVLGGEFLATVTVPRGLNVLSIGSDMLVGTETDSLGVERVVGYEIVPGNRSPRCLDVAGHEVREATVRALPRHFRWAASAADFG
jgi:hypothetical protein